VPWANSVVETELPRWSGACVAWHYARLVPASGSTALDLDFLSGLLAAVPAALRQLAALQLDRVYLACTSAAFMFPQRPQSAGPEDRVPVMTAFDAILAALDQRHASKIVLLAPYPRDVCDAETSAFRGHGITVTGQATLNLRDGYAGVSLGQIADLARQAGREAIKEAHAIVLSCTGWPTFGPLTELGAELGKAVISSNFAIAGDAISRIQAGDCP
jgi:maleate isomerase